MSRQGGSTATTPFGPFLLERRLAVGGSAEVFLARPKRGTNPAPKLVVKRLIAGRDENQFNVLDREAELHRAVKHENVVTVFGAGMVGNEPYLAMEYVEGVDLYRLLRFAEAEQQTIPIALSVFVVRSVAAALAAVHSACDPSGEPLGIVHRDVTPSNVYLSTTGAVKVGDFGIARVSERVRAPSANPGLKGKFAYLAPEQIAGEVFDHRVDLFALAAILGELLIGERIFPGSGQLAVLLAIRDANIEPLRRHQGRLPAGLYAICEKALARNPDDRYPDAEALSAALAEFQSPYTQEELVTELATLVQHASDSKRMALHIRDSVQRMRAVALRQHQSTSPDSVPPVSLDKKAARALTPEARRPPAPVESAAATPPVEEAQIRCKDGRTYQHVNFGKLLELLATGELSGDDEVAFGVERYHRIGDLPELARHLLPSTTQTTRQMHMPGGPDYRAMLGETPMLLVLAKMREDRETGALFVERADRTGRPQRKELYLKSGKLHHVASSDRTELLGEYLVRRGALTRAQLETALGSLQRFGGRLGDTMIALGFVEAVDVFRAIRDQGRDRVAAICGWTRGGVSFYRGAEPVHVEFPLDLDLASPMMAGAIVAAKDNLRGQVGPDDNRLAPGPRHYLAFDPVELGTSPSSIRMVPKLAGERTTVGEALAYIMQPRPERNIGEKEACAALIAAKTLGWVEL
jgi:serine/threonine-protein kinase